MATLHDGVLCFPLLLSEDDFHSTSHTIRLSTGTTETELQNYIEVVDDAINEPVQNLALVVSVSGQGIEKTICFTRGQTGPCQGRVGSTVLKITDDDGMYINNHHLPYKPSTHAIDHTPTYICGQSQFT